MIVRVHSHLCTLFLGTKEMTITDEMKDEVINLFLRLSTDFKDRLREEYTTLVKRASKLEAFLNSPDSAVNVPLAQYELMVKQLSVMQDYCAILEQRLKLANSD